MHVAAILRPHPLFPEGPVPAGKGRIPASPPASSGEPNPGDILDGRFELLELVSRGGMACVFRGRDLETGGTVAVKLPLLRYEADPLTYSRFERETEIARRLDHPYILKILAADRPRSRPYLVMEFLEGEPLQRLAGGRPMAEEQAAAIAAQICEALEHLRARGIVHRDLKPENVFVCRDGSIRLIDFGIAAALRLRRLTFIGQGPAMGTPDYMAPEQARGRRSDHRADIYGLGAILFQLLTGRPPFEGDDAWVVMQARLAGDPPAPRSLRPELSSQVEEIVLHALAREPRDRYATAADMGAELRDRSRVWLSGRAARLKPVRIRFWHANPWAVRGIAMAAAALILMAASFGGAYWFFLHFGRR